MSGLIPRRVRVLVNRKSGLMWSFDAVQNALERFWDLPGTELTYQFCKSADDGRMKARQAVESEHDVLLVMGGDGTINSVASVLIGTNTALGAIPMGSGNGFARHFGIPLAPEKAVQSLANASIARIDVGMVDERPFLVTCSMAWDAAIVRSFEKSPVRGILPYIFAGVYEFLEYEPQEMTVELDSGETLSFALPLVFTIANLTQYGGGAVIAPHARPDDGLLELVVASRQDIARLFSNIIKLFHGAVTDVPEVVFHSFKSLKVKRQNPTAIQIDGELAPAPAEITVKTLPKALNVLVPRVRNETD